MLLRKILNAKKDPIMSIGKYISLEEARRQNKLARFIKFHKTTGNKKQFKELLGNMAFKKKPKGGQTS